MGIEKRALLMEDLIVHRASTALVAPWEMPPDALAVLRRCTAQCVHTALRKIPSPSGRDANRLDLFSTVSPATRRDPYLPPTTAEIHRVKKRG